MFALTPGRRAARLLSVVVTEAGGSVKTGANPTAVLQVARTRGRDSYHLQFVPLGSKFYLEQLPPYMVGGSALLAYLFPDEGRALSRTAVELLSANGIPASDPAALVAAMQRGTALTLQLSLSRTALRTAAGRRGGEGHASAPSKKTQKKRPSSTRAKGIKALEMEAADDDEVEERSVRSKSKSKKRTARKATARADKGEEEEKVSEEDIDAIVASVLAELKVSDAKKVGRMALATKKARGKSPAKKAAPAKLADDDNAEEGGEEDEVWFRPRAKATAAAAPKKSPKKPTRARAPVEEEEEEADASDDVMTF